MLEWKKDQNQADWHMIREEVFVKEQGFQNEFDDIDDDATHICVYENGKAIGCIRFYVENEKMRIGRLAVLKQARNRQLGAYLLKLAETEIKNAGYHEVYLDAQCRVMGFYEKQGYVTCGEQHMDEHVPHVLMKKVL